MLPLRRDLDWRIAKEHSYSSSFIEGKQRWTMYLLKNGQGYRGPQSSLASSFLPKKGINMAPTGPFDLNSFRLH